MNPFDSNFFKFLGGFILILGMTFLVIIVTQVFVDIDSKSVSASINRSGIIIKK